LTSVSLRHITKHFGPVVATSDASLEVASGEVHAILGENGAGKTSLMNVLAGVYRADEGEILLDGQPVQIHSPRDAKRLGIGMVHQEQRLVTRFTAPENVAIGHVEPRWLTPQRYFRALADRLTERYRLQIDASSQIWSLPIGRRQRVELVKLLHHGARVIILDEPTSNLAPAEITTFFEAMRRLAAEGRTVILITHKLDEVLRFADRVTVMRGGRVVSTFAAAETTRDELNRLMIGEVIAGEARPADDAPREVVLQVAGLSVGDPHLRDSLTDVNLTVRAGEVVALAGVAGNGQTRFAEAITGNVPDFAGEVTIGGRNIRHRSGRDVARLGVGYIPENRKEVGLVLGESVAINLALRRYDRRPFCRWGWLDRKAMTEAARTLIETYEIRTPSPETPVGRLSGGNQQRVIVARELADNPRLIVADNFTRGLDPRSTQRFQQELFARRDAGAAVIWITGDLAEALICDRIAVMRQGRIVAVLDWAQADAEAIGLLMSGDDAAEAVRAGV
jgi:simple sugar transport system ATP-binding protein